MIDHQQDENLLVNHNQNKLIFYHLFRFF